jgi:hypothetical protein
MSNGSKAQRITGGAMRPMLVLAAIGAIAAGGTVVAGQAAAIGGCNVLRPTAGWSSQPNSRAIIPAGVGNRIILGGIAAGPAPRGGMVYGANLDSATYNDVYAWWDRGALRCH